MTRLNDAIELAIKYHDGQKYADEPYINHLASDFAVNPKYVTCKNCLKMIKPVCDFSNNSPCSDCGKIDIHDFYHCNNKYTKGW